MDEDFMQFGEVRTEGPTPRACPFRDPELGPRLRQMWRILPEDRMAIYLHEAASRAMVRLAFDAPGAEVGGLLLGGYHVDGESEFVVVDELVEARHVLASSHSLRFTHETWGAMTRELAARPGRGRIVGWFHSHPRSAAFLSEDDQFIHRNFFGQPWQVAVVVSVRDQILATFQWREDVLVGRCGYYLIEDVPAP